MPRNRPRPAPRHKAPRSLLRQRPALPRGSRRRSALRWVVATPTFAAGLGVVIAAAIGMPAPSVVFSRLPPSGILCPNPRCRPLNPLATGPKAKRLANPPRHKHDSGQTGGSGQGSGSGILVEYQSAGQHQQGTFAGRLVLASETGKALPSWHLRFGYLSGSIQVMGVPQPPGAHTATVSSAQYRGGSGSQGTVQIIFWVSGSAGPARRPASCTINGQSCHYVPNLLGRRSPSGGWGGGSGWPGFASQGG